MNQVASQRQGRRLLSARAASHVCAANCGKCCADRQIFLMGAQWLPPFLRARNGGRKLCTDPSRCKGISIMKHFLSRAMAAAAGTCVLAAPLYAALQPGAQAPDFTTQATLAGKPFKFALADALKKGPVVLYFYPAAFTPAAPSKRTSSPRPPTNSRRWAPPSSAFRMTTSAS